MRLFPLVSLAGLAVLSTAVAACSGGEGSTTTGTGGTPATTGTGGEGGSGGAGGSAGSGGGLICVAPFVTKGPWVLAVDETSAKIRWEACQSGAAKGVRLTNEGSGAEQTATSTESAVTLTETHIAVFNPDVPPDYAGTYYMHEATLSGLEQGACYTYSLEADPARQGRFCTARPSGQDFSFLAIGDTNPSLGHTAPLLATVLPEKPEFTIHGGDLQYYSSGLETWASWFPVLQPMLSRGAFFPAIGNHETEKDDELSEYALRFFGGAGFDGGETYYRFRTGGVHFFSLNTEESIGQGSPQATWLEATLAKASAEPGYRFSVVFFHRPLITCGDKPSDDAARAFLEPIFLANKVALVLQAHMHGYERFELDNGLTYVTSGGGGGTLADIDENIAQPYCDKRVASAAVHHAVLFQVGPGALSAKAIDEEGTVIDTFTKTVP